MNITHKKRAVNIGFGLGIAFVVVGLLMTWFLPTDWSGWATFVAIVGVIAALVGFVFAILLAREQG